MSSPVQSVEVSYIVQMTEDEERVQRAVAELLGRTDLAVERQVAEGHYGNTIVWVRLRATGSEAEEALARVVSALSPEERRSIIDGLAGSVDEHGALYMRLSKQALVLEGRASLGTSDPVRVRVKPRGRALGADPGGFYARLIRGEEPA